MFEVSVEIIDSNSYVVDRFVKVVDSPVGLVSLGIEICNELVPGYDVKISVLPKEI